MQHFMRGDVGKKVRVHLTNVFLSLLSMIPSTRFFSFLARLTFQLLVGFTYIFRQTFNRGN